MKFSPQQQRALDHIAQWLKSSQQVCRLFGYAGTGKTTLAKHIDADGFAAYTGKAAYVLRQKGCHNASTIHQLIYIPKEKSKELLLELRVRLEKFPEDMDLQARIRQEEENLRRPSFSLNIDSDLRRMKLLVIDECSMVNEETAKHLMSFGTKILVLGDPAQLPPVRGAGFFTNAKPDIMLTEVHRQAQESPIIDLATRVRQQHEITTEHECVVPRGKWAEDPALLLDVDQLIVGKNVTRRAMNANMRRLLGHASSSLPEVGEKLVCGRNNHKIGILNGATYTATAVNTEDAHAIFMELDGEIELSAHREPFLGEEVPFFARYDHQLFEYGYALTCHKSQGSQWPSVGIIDESRSFRKDRYRWLYTAITRAADRLWVAKG